MSGPPKSRGMIQYVFKHFWNSFKATLDIDVTIHLMIAKSVVVMDVLFEWVERLGEGSRWAT